MRGVFQCGGNALCQKEKGVCKMMLFCSLERENNMTLRGTEMK